MDYECCFNAFENRNMHGMWYILSPGSYSTSHQDPVTMTSLHFMFILTLHL